MLNTKIADHHLTRHACIYIRQSTPAQVRFNQQSTERQYNLANQAKALGWTPEQIRILDGDPPIGTADVQTRRLQDPCERRGYGASRCDLLSRGIAPGALQQGLASIAGTMRHYQDLGVRWRRLLRPGRFQRQPRPWHEGDVRSGRTAYHSRAPPRR